MAPSSVESLHRGCINTLENVRLRSGSFLSGMWTPGVRTSNRKVMAEKETNSNSFPTIYSSDTEQSNRPSFNIFIWYILNGLSQ